MMRKWCGVLAWALALCGVLGLLAQPALAFDVASPIKLNSAGVLGFDSSVTLSNNTSGTAAGLSATLAVASGGTNLTSAADDNVMVGNATTWQSKALTTCTGAGKAVTYDAATNTFGCNTITAGANPPLTFSSETKIPAGSTTVYMGLGGRLSATEADVIAPVSASTFMNLRCYSSGTTGGSGVAVSVGTGACTAGLTYTSTPTVTPTSTTAVADTSNSATTTANQCVALKLVPASTTTATFINCTLERTA